jgi:3-deoxy-D-manno-octulosonic-acid transferase
MLLLYDFAIRCYAIGIKTASLFHPKAGQWIKGRQDLFTHLENALSGNKNPVIWMHCASLGEFEQGRPVLEQLRQRYPNYFILLTFFSPSGYTIRKDYDQVSYVTYLPLDTAANASRFINLVQPKVVLFVKYEFWYHFLTILRRSHIPTILISAIFRKEQHFFKVWGTFFRDMLRSFQHIFVQDEASEKRLRSIGVQQVSCSGDTRVDRVLQIAATAKSFPEIAAFLHTEKVLICGSTWPKDEARIRRWQQKEGADWQLIIAPHDISEPRLKEVEQLFAAQTIRYSKISNPRKNTNCPILIIDNIGMLSSLYRYGRLAYIGGGFGAGIHSILEPAAFGLPLCFGPRYEQFREAKELVTKGAAFVVGDMAEIIRHLSDQRTYENCKTIVTNYMEESRGATDEVVAYVESLIASRLSHGA